MQQSATPTMNNRKPAFHLLAAMLVGLATSATAADTWTLKIDNQSDIADPWIVFTSAPDVTFEKFGPAAKKDKADKNNKKDKKGKKGKGGLTKVVNNEGIQLSTVKDATFTVTTISEVIFISDKKLNLGNGRPNPTNDSDPNNATRWQPVEFKSDGGTMYCDITYVNYYCIPIAMSTHGTATPEALTALRAKLANYGAVQNAIMLSPATFIWTPSLVRIS